MLRTGMTRRGRIARSHPARAHTLSNPTGQNPNQPPVDPASYPQGNGGAGYAPVAQQPEKKKNTLGLVALIVAVIGFIFACIPGALIIGWILLPIAFILSLVSLFLRDKKQGLGIAGLLVSIVGTVVGFLVFFLVVGGAFNDAVDELSSGTEVTVSSSDDDESSDGSTGTGEGDQGTRANPYPLGSTVSDDDWSVTINSVDLDANDEVLASNSMNSPASEGMTYILINATITYEGDSDDGEMPWTTIEYVTADGNTISSLDSSDFAITPDRLDTLSDLYQGGSTTGNVLLTVPADSADQGVLAVEPGLFSQKAFIAVI